MRRRVALALLLACLGGRGADAASAEDVVVSVATGKKPSAGLDVRLAVKAWPGGAFRLTHHDARTDTKGVATFRGIVPTGTRYGLYATVATAGTTLASRYVWSGEPKPPARIDLDVERAGSLRIVCVGDDGKPLRGVAIAPGLRCEASGARHAPPASSTSSAAQTAGADGRVELEYFLPGEWAGAWVRFPGHDEELRTFRVPTEPGTVVKLAATAPRMPDEDLTAAGDPKQRFFLFGPKVGDVEPPAGWSVLLVLPGGDGGAGFREFVRERYEAWVDAGWVAVELVAPAHGASATLVWPTEVSKADGLPFTTEAFVAAALEEVRKRRRIDARRVVAVSWSSSGPVAWRMLSQKASPIAAHLVAMSVFRPKDLDDLRNGKKRPLELLHAPDDTRCPIRLAEQGRDAATKAGLDVGWATYTGGHGWAGDSLDLARAALFRIRRKLP